MKLLLCKVCGSIFNLTLEEKICVCGKTKGRYLEDRWHAVYSGPAIPIGFSNPSFSSAIINQNKKEDSVIGERFTAFIIPDKCDMFIKEELA